MGSVVPATILAAVAVDGQSVALDPILGVSCAQPWGFWGKADSRLQKTQEGEALRGVDAKDGSGVQSPKDVDGFLECAFLAPDR